MPYIIVESSPKAMTKIKNFEDAIGTCTNEHQRSKYPWSELKIGQSFTVDVREGNEASLRNGAAGYSRKSGKKLAVFKHGDLELFEVARLA